MAPTTEILYTTDYPITRYGQTILRRAIRRIFPHESVQMWAALPEDTHVLQFGVDTPSPREWGSTLNIERILAGQIRKHLGLPPEERKEPHSGRVLYLDIESHDSNLVWDMDPDEFVRLIQYAWGSNGEVRTTTDREAFLELIREADMVVGHNIHAFDLTALFGKDSIEPLHMAAAGKIFDTFVFANLAFPAPAVYTKRDGKRASATKPEQIMAWLGLDNLAFQLGIDGKLGDLKALAKKYGGFGNIPLDDPEFYEYALQDIRVLQELTHELLCIKEPDAYDWREQFNAAIDAQNSRNGFRVDIAAAEARVSELSIRRQVLLEDIQERYDFPRKGKAPWATAAGKAAIMKALEGFGITPETHPQWEKTKTGNLSLGGDALKDLCRTASEEAQEFAAVLAEIKGQRTLAQQALEHAHKDGKSHPSVTSLQRSGRKSTTKPALTIWSAHGEKAIEKSYFIPDSDDELLVELDYSNADQRIVAAYSGDEVYLERMEEGFDGHEMSGRLLFGDDQYDSNPKMYRQVAKPAGHGWAYRATWKTVMKATGVKPQQAQNFCAGMDARYAKVVAWQNRMSSLGEIGYLTNDWGRRMVVESGRSYTQSPALMGQSGTREIVVDALIRMYHADVRLLTWLKAQVHDALVFSIPKADLDWAVPLIRECMETSWQPSDGSGQLIHFPVSAGTPSTDWQKAGH